MKLLLDTHVLLWWLEDPALLSEAARTAIQDGKNTVFISVATVWEIVIKKSLGKLDIPNNLETVIAANRFLSLPISMSHALTIEKLPPHHRDPFDRMLIAQAIHDELVMVSRDPHILKYRVSHLVA